MTVTEIKESAIPRTVGRKKLWAERILVPLPKGTLARIAAVLKDSEVRLDFVRVAIERELQRREKPTK